MAGTNDNSPFNPGDRFGDYTVERMLGRGSMGTVYLMRSPDGSPFAVKIMHRSAMSRDMVTRFAREAEFAMEIRHRNLITVYDAGEDPDTGLCYIIMDYMPGGTLSDRIKKLGTIPIGDAVKITMHIAAALDIAHRNGLVHRDVKPDNIMFAADGTPKLADLGVAKFNEDRNTMVTMTGMVIGTPAYMSPEQLMDSHNIDARSDIYSLGVILYEMLTGKRPNSGSTAVELLAKAIKGDPLPDIRTVRPETSAAIAHVLSIMCAPKPDDRPATAVAAAQLLRNAATGKLVLPKKPPRAADAAARKSKRWIPAAAGIVGAAILAAAAMFFTNGRSGNKNRNNAVSCENLDSRSYVQDGLVAMWDGVENAGRGRHDPKAKAWKNLVGGPDAEQAGSLPVEWSNNAALFGSDRYLRVNSLFGKPQKVTVEVCHRANPLTSKKHGYFSALFSSCENGGIGFQSGNDTKWRVLVANPGGWYYSEIQLPALRDRAETLAFTVDESIIIYRNAKVFGLVPGIDGIRYNENHTFQIGRDPGNDGDIVGEIYSIRFYSRSLSADEIRRNHEIDRIRFNLDRVGAAKSIPAVAEKSAVAGVKASPPAGAWQPGPTSDWFVEWDKALAEAKKTGKKLFVLSTGSDWCGWCKRLRANVLDKQEFIDFARKNLVLLYLDNPHANPLCEEQKVHNKQIVKALGFGGGVPNVEIFSTDGKMLGDISGGGYKLDAYLEKLEGILSRKDGAPVRNDELFANGGYQTLKEKIDAKRVKLPPVTKEDFKAHPEKKPTEPQQAKSGQIALIPRLDRNPKAWAYSFEDMQGWKAPDFDDSKWKRAQGGFGQRRVAGQLPHAHINTTWDSERIFLRKRFNWSGGDISRVVADAYHDDEADLYLNGEFLLTINGSNFDWQPFEIPVERFAKALRSGENVFCVEVRNSGGHCQYFDCGLVVECGGTLAVHAGPDCIRKIKTDVGTWTVMVKDGTAQIGDGRNVALDPRPEGTLKIPLELDGLKIRKLASNCFNRCDRLETVIIPEGVHSVGAAAFFNCGQLSKITVPETLEHFGWEALHRTGLKHIDLKNTRLIEGSVFKFCERLDKVSVSHGNFTFAVRDGVLYDRVRRAVVFCPRSGRSCDIPLGIEEIYDSAFTQSNIKSIEIPATVIGVWDCAFEACPLLESVRFKGDDVIFGIWAFANNPSLKSIVLPSRQKSLDAQAIFRNAEKLESVRLPDTVETIGVGVFEDCSRLKTINLGKSIRLVRWRAFCRCSQLREIEFPKTLNELESEVFRDCKSLNRVVFHGNAPALSDCDGHSGDDIYIGANPSLTTFVPEGSTGWSIVSPKLPKEWPEAAGEYARPIRFASKRGRTRK